MPETELLISFLLATAAFAYFPGPAMLYTAARTMAHGRRAGLSAVLGIHIGGYAHVIAATFGLTAVLHHVPAAYLAVKLAGAAYLVWIGLGMLRQATKGHAPAASDRPQFNPAFLQSVVVQLLNPKVALFYLAFLPQFVDPMASLSVSMQLLLMGLVVNLAFASADLMAVLLTERVMALTRGRRSGLGLVRALGGSILVALGVRLALSRS